MYPSTFLSQVATGDRDLPAGVAVPLDVEVNGATNWTYLLTNTGDEDVTAATIAYSPLGGRFTDPEALPAGLPLAPGATLPIVGQHRPVAALRLVLTSANGTTVAVEGGGR